MPLDCPFQQTYFASIDECVPDDIASTQAFIDNINIDVSCPTLGLYRTAADIQSLRYCNRITGSLIIDSTDADVDFSALYDITIIEGEMKQIIVNCRSCVVQDIWSSATQQ